MMTIFLFIVCPVGIAVLGLILYKREVDRAVDIDIDDEDDDMVL
jgi:hypothetical protein